MLLSPLAGRLALLICLALTLMVGCNRTEVTEGDVRQVLARTEPPPTVSGAYDHDFGPVLAHGQLLGHEFTLNNPTDHPLHLGRPELSTPCCTAAEGSPEVIPARGSASFRVSFRPGMQSGPKRVGFVVPTDSTKLPRFDLHLTANLFGEIQVESVVGPSAPVFVRRGSTQRFRVISRSAGRLGRSAPDRLAASAGLAARFVEREDLTTSADGIVTMVRVVEVALPPIDRPGPQRGEVRVIWSDGRDQTCPVAWQVRPLLQANPSGLVFRSGAGRQDFAVVIRAEDRPICVVAVTGPTLVTPLGPLTGPAARVQTLRLTLDPARATAPTTTISVQTDHPDQPEVALTVLATPHVGQEQP